MYRTVHLDISVRLNPIYRVTSLRTKRRHFYVDAKNRFKEELPIRSSESQDGRVVSPGV